MWYIVGLGNPGKKYENTRHNVGFFVLNLLAKRYKLKFNSNRKGIRRLLGSMKYLSASGYISDEEVLLIKPMTYMNRSGRALLKLFKQKTKAIVKITPRNKLEPERIRLFSIRTPIFN